MSAKHYENFPVASWLCPAPLRPAVMAIYHFARTADDIADEGDAAPATRLADIAAYRSDLDAVFASRPLSGRWPQVFGRLAAVVARHGLPLPLLADLLDAFAQDVTQTRYADRAELLDYCRRSANPIGRLLLHLYGVRDVRALAQSDAICSALQLINFWQDLGIDARRGRLYVPEQDCRRHGLDPLAFLTVTDTPATRALVLELAAWARELMSAGAPLVHALPGRAGLELRLVVQGGLRIVDKIERLGGATLAQRPVIGIADAPFMVWRGIVMRPGTQAALSPGSRA